MPWVAPVRVATGGDTVDSTMFTRDYTISCNAGDLVTFSALSSNYPLDIQSISGGGISWAFGAYRSLGSGYGNAWTFYGTSPTTQTFTVRIQMQNNINSTIYYSLFRWYVWRSHGGIGYTGAYRGSGEPWLYVNQTAEKSSFIHASVDWNATAANGTWLNEAGTASDGVLVRSGAGIYWANSNLDSTGIANNKRLGITNSSSTRLTGVGLEVKGIYVDQAQPSAVSSLAATPLSDSAIRVDWGAATDDVGVTGYRIYDFGTQVGQVASNVFTFTHSGLAAASSHQYTVRAFDAAGNLGGVLESKNASTLNPATNKLYVGTSRPSIRLGTTLVTKMFVGTDQVWP